MLQLSSVTKTYSAGGFTQTALDHVSLSFRESEFVAILGPSGSGKTTLLNIIGGLDRYDSGDLLINGRSTREYKPRDWDTYRNHSVGFVFQSYNLIPHQTVLRNVELALTLSGVSPQERRRRALEVLDRVGLRDHVNKRPAQMSGGQMQRVAIARALINDPDILLADEPTGALDTDTSLQIMELLREVARDRLIIMVTHNPELAERYATRIVRLRDGQIQGDTDPFDPTPEQSSAARQTVPGIKKGKRSMSLWTAVSLSLNNLLTKKGRTFMTAFAGSIGIIGIALILSLSHGINRYIDRVQEDTLSSYPITIEAESVDMSSMLSSLMGARDEETGSTDAAAHREADRVYSSTVMYDLLNSMVNAETETNDLRAFKAYLDEGGGGITDLAVVRYGYDLAMDIYTQDPDGGVVKSDVMTMMESAMTTLYGGDYSSYFSSMGSMYQGMDVWEELLPGEGDEAVARQVQSQYDLLYGEWPRAADEVILFVNGNNELSDLMLYALGYISAQDMSDSMTKLMNGEALEVEEQSWSYEELCSTVFKAILPSEYYQADAAGGYVDLSATGTGLDYLYHSSEVGLPLRVVGIARPSESASASMVRGAIGYTSLLTEYMLGKASSMEVIRAQLDDPETDVLTGLPFASGEEETPSREEMTAALQSYFSAAPAAEKAQAYENALAVPSDDEISAAVSAQLSGLTREALESAIIDQYAGDMGVSGDTIASYIREMSDEELFSQAEEGIAAQVREQYAAAVRARLSALTADQLSAALDAALSGAGQPLTDAQILWLYENSLPPTHSDSTYADNLKTLGYVDPASPSSVSLYASTFSGKDAIADLIQAYNDSAAEEQQITYTDYVALLMSSITGIISGVSYLLIAFVSISLVVSSIMIGIITYISVLERTKEIGILRAIGASRRDVSRVFNAETLIVGLGAGVLGIGVTLLLLIPINALLLHLTGLTGLSAALPPAGGAVLVLISVLLTLVAGLIPARVASKKDPVEALRSE